MEDPSNPARNFLPGGYRLHPWERWEYYGFVVGGFFAYIHNLSQRKPKWANLYRYPLYSIGLGAAVFAFQRWKKENEVRRMMIYVDYTRKHPEEFVKLESRPINETWDHWIIRRGP